MRVPSLINSSSSHNFDCKCRHTARQPYMAKKIKIFNIIIIKLSMP